MNEDEKARPNVIDSLLYGTEYLKTVLIDNHALQGEFRPINEFKDVMKKNGREFAKALINEYLRWVGLTEQDLNEFEKKYYGN